MFKIGNKDKKRHLSLLDHELAEISLVDDDDFLTVFYR